MRNGAIAEWIVSRFTSAREAAAVIGDLEELRPRKGVLWFWASLAGFLFFLCWRRLLALLAAFWLSDHFFQVAVLGTKSHYYPRNVPVLLFLVLAAVSYFLWMTSLYAAIRYGYFDKTTQMIVRWSAIIGTIFVSWDHPIVVSLFIALCGLQAFLSMAKPEEQTAVPGGGNDGWKWIHKLSIDSSCDSFCFLSRFLHHRSRQSRPGAFVNLLDQIPAEFYRGMGYNQRLFPNAFVDIAVERTQNDKRA